MLLPKLLITGWQPGLQEVSAARLLVENTSYGLKEAKDCVDAVLEGSQATITVPDTAKAETLATQLRAIGAVVTVQD